MTPSQVAKIFRAKDVRGKRGYWKGKCPIHGDHKPSLWIMEGEQGRTIIGCWSGCDKEVMLAAVGLKMSDLFAGGMPDKKALEEAEQLRAAEGRERTRKKAAIRRAIDFRNYWRNRMEMLGKSLMESPESDRIGSQFHSALEKARMFDAAVVEQMCSLYGFKPDYFVLGD